MASDDQLRDLPETSPSATGEQKPFRASIGRLVLLVLGDAVVFLIFSLVGRRSHSEAVGLDAILQTLGTALPFALAWFVVAPFVGGYRRNLLKAPKQMAKQTALAWTIAWPLAMILRIMLTGRTPEWTFFLISYLSNLLFLQIWRVGFAWFGRPRHNSD